MFTFLVYPLPPQKSRFFSAFSGPGCRSCRRAASSAGLVFCLMLVPTRKIRAGLWGGRADLRMSERTLVRLDASGGSGGGGGGGGGGVI